MEKENIEKQLLEIEVLRSIYSNLNEFTFDNEDAFIEAQVFLSQPDDKTLLEKKLGFSIKFSADGVDDNTDQNKLPLELVCRLPTSYPLSSPPDIFVRSLSVKLDRNFSEELSNYVKSSHDNDSAILDIIEWIKDNVGRFINGTSGKKSPNQESKNVDKLVYERVFFYSHHIFSSEKRRCILQWAQELNLTGFFMPGKPGIICVEGDRTSVQSYCAKLRSVPWQKLQIRENQSFELSPSEWESVKKFKDFEEKLFTSNNQTFDLGILFVFLKEKNLEYVFNLYFGVDGKLPSTS
ncbi:RWD domain-containing 2B [Brachionus plicatilis]|uniref:RWD domain-containing 2B n=1 Tax=Brachionus plicatilis TaxID=10195 RepID=A0A3M7QXF1_BRAPC|nr:RWD domain-containing 2B [Brachionus plicatilis]